MDEPRWIGVGERAHAFCNGNPRSLCSRETLPVDFIQDLAGRLPRCPNCQVVVVQRLSHQHAAEAVATQQWHQAATETVLGPGWTYAEVQRMPTWLETVDRVAIALAESYREGILQGSSDTHTGDRR